MHVVHLLILYLVSVKYTSNSQETYLSNTDPTPRKHVLVYARTILCVDPDDADFRPRFTAPTNDMGY